MKLPTSTLLAHQGRSHEKKLLFFWILSKLPPPNLDKLHNFFLNAKNVDLSDIQKDSLGKPPKKWKFLGIVPKPVPPPSVHLQK